MTRVVNEHLSNRISLKSSSLSLHRSVRQSLSLVSSLSTPIAVSIPARQAHLHLSPSILAKQTFVSSRLLRPRTATMIVSTTTTHNTATRTSPFLLPLIIPIFSAKLSFPDSFFFICPSEGWRRDCLVVHLADHPADHLLGHLVLAHRSPKYRPNRLQI
ncbi:hypothetical protein ES703_36598 [subsurface metagenome]